MLCEIVCVSSGPSNRRLSGRSPTQFMFTEAPTGLLTGLSCLIAWSPASPMATVSLSVLTVLQWHIHQFNG